MSKAKTLTETVELMEVLHVDDDPGFADLTATVLEREDDQFTVETVTTVDMAVERIDDRRPDCIVSDYNMPGMNGLEFLQAVRERYPDLPFILFTGKGSEAIAGDAISAGVTDYLQKGSGTERYELLANRIRNAVRARRKAQRVDRQRQLARLTEFAGDTGGWELGRESGTVLLTAGSRRIIGRPDRAEIPLEEAIALFHPDDREEIQQTLTRAFETGEELHNTWRLQPGGGDERLIEMTITPAVESGGKVTKLRGAGHDITARKERRQELEDRTEKLETLTTELQAQYRYLFEEAPVMAVVTRAEDGRPIVEDCNDLFVETLSHEKSEVIGAQLERFYTTDSQRKLLEEDGYERGLSGEFVRENRELMTADGETVETLLRAVPREGAREESPGTLAFYIDISERKRVKRQRDRLEEFASIVSHDLRSPLTVADGHIELAQQKCDSDHLARAADAIDRSQALIDDLLTLAREGEAVTGTELSDLQT